MTTAILWSLKFFCLEKEVFKFEGWKPFSLSKPSFSKWRNGDPRGPVTYTRLQSCFKSGPQPRAPGLSIPMLPAASPGAGPRGQPHSYCLPEELENPKLLLNTGLWLLLLFSYPYF